MQSGATMKTEGIHRVRKKKADGSLRYYYYAYRGGPQFWATDNYPEVEPFPKAFFRALKLALMDKPKPNKSKPGSFDETIDDFLVDDAFLKRSKDTRDTYEGYIPAIRIKFGEAPMSWFERKETRETIYKWRKRVYGNKARSGDLAITTLVRILNWAVDKGRIARHVASNMSREHKSDRSEIIWLPEEIDILCSHLPNENSKRIIRFAALTGLRRKDICSLQTSSDNGGWIEVATSKSNKKTTALVPVTDEIREIIDWFGEQRKKRPHAPMSMLFNSRFRPYTPDGLSSVFTRARDKSGIKKRFHDLKGTAVTHYASCGFEKEEIARFVGWEVDTVNAILYTYVEKSAHMQAAVSRLRAVK